MGQRRGLPMLACVWALAALLTSSWIRSHCMVAAAGQKVRKELRSLTGEELQLYVTGVTVMLNTSTADGQRIYGKAFREYDYFIVKHAVTVGDLRGDQGHFGPCFITFHRALSMEFENSLLSVVPKLGAMPYWNLLLDVRGGPYAYPHPKNMFSSNFAGSIWTSAANGYSPIDGLFNDRPIPRFNRTKYKSILSVYSGADRTGLLRGQYTPTTNPYVVRFPTKLTDTDCYYSDSRPGEFQMNYHLKDWQLCLDPKKFKTMMDWHWCIDFNGYQKSSAVTSGIDRIILSTCSSSLHAGPHLCVGGSRSDGTPGDFMDIATAPNEVLMFFLHHANIDRSFMIWQTAAAKNDAKLSTRSVLWRYPADPNLFAKMKEPYVRGCYLRDTICSKMPFTDIFSDDQVSTNKDGFTHADVLWYTRPGFSPYVYDNMGTGI